MRTSTRAVSAVVAVGLATGIAACSSDPKPQGEFTTLTGNATSVGARAELRAGTHVTQSDSRADRHRHHQQDRRRVVPDHRRQGQALQEGRCHALCAGPARPQRQRPEPHRAASTVVDLKNFVIDPGNNSKLTGEVDVDGKVAYKSVKLFDLDGNTLRTPTLSGGVATLTGTTVYLSKEAAVALDKVFKITALKGGVGSGVKIGVATIKATGK